MLRVNHLQGFNAMRSSASAGWTPASLGSTLLAWLQGDLISGSDLDLIATWEDSTANNNDATQGVDANKPKLRTAALNGMNVVEFYEGASGTDSFQLVNVYSGKTAGTIFAVIKADFDPSANTSANAWVDFGGAASSNHYPYTDGTIYDGNLSTARKTVGNPTPDLAGWRITSVHSTASDYQFWIDGVSIYSTATNTFDGGTRRSIGTNLGGEYFDGRMAELIFTDTVLSSSDREKVEGYLAHKWALTGNLDGGHPYKTTPP